MTRWPTAVLALILAASGGGGALARAEGPAYTPAYGRCLDRPEAQSTMGTIECIGVEFQVQDARLNRAYADAMGRMTTQDQKDNLRAAQRAWIAYRDADCLSRASPEWGSLSRVDAANCRLEHTYRRADDLQDYGTH